jgi:transcriptional regulator with XRE-family HTH domain
MKALKEYLKKNKLTARAFSKISGIDESQLSRYLNGTTLPSLENAHKIEDVTKRKVKTESWLC